MDRLTLNILLSFAQFDREIIGQRIRDKTAATAKKGKCIGGNPFLGYDLDRENMRLLVNPNEAATLVGSGTIETSPAIHNILRHCDKFWVCEIFLWRDATSLFIVTYEP